MAQRLHKSQSQKLRPAPNENFSKPLPRAGTVAYRSPRRVHDDIVLGGVFAGRQSFYEGREPGRPSTSNGVLYEASKPGPREHAGVFASVSPSPAVIYAAEIRSREAQPYPKSPGKAITTDYECPYPIHGPPLRHQTTAYVPTAPHGAIAAVADGQQRPKLSRWQSLRGLFGRKPTQSNSSSLPDAPAEESYAGVSSRTRSTRGPAHQHAPPAKRVGGKGGRSREPRVIATDPRPSSSTTSVATYVPTRGNTVQRPAQRYPNRNIDNGFQGGHSYKGGSTTATKPIIDVDIPDIHLERYSVMFGSLTKADASPTLLVRRQSKANKRGGAPLEPLQTSTLAYLDTKPCPPTPRSAAKYQLSLFPTPSPRLGHLNPLGMHKPKALHHSQAGTSPCSPKRPFTHDHQASISSDTNTLSQEVPVRLDLTPQRTGGAGPPTTSYRETSHVTEPATPVAHIVELWQPPAPEPKWDMVAIPERTRRRGSSESTSVSAALTAFSGETAVERPEVQVSVARQMSLKRARSVKRDLETGAVLHRPTLVDKRTLTPTVVELGHRAKARSHCVEIEGV